MDLKGGGMIQRNGGGCLALLVSVGSSFGNSAGGIVYTAIQGK